MAEEVSENTAQSRYELVVDGKLAIAEYQRKGDTLVFTHTLVPDEIGGRGVGTTLIRGALDSVRAQHLKIVPRCSFVAGFVQKHPEYSDLVSNRS
jgi:predicted GNAT family acetyltransferase